MTSIEQLIDQQKSEVLVETPSCRNILNLFSLVPVFSGDEKRFLPLAEARLNELKRKELTNSFGKAQEHRGLME